MNRLISILILSLISIFSLHAQKNLELPKTKSGEIIVHHTGHTLSYNESWLIPNWVAYELIADELEGDAERAKRFSPDPLLERYPRAEHSHYTNTGWVRGHMIPAGDLKYSQNAMNDSFYTSNVCPMNVSFNNGLWKRLEEKIRKWAIEYGRVYIITGPIMGNNTNGKVGNSNILIPDMFFKAVLIPKDDSYQAIGFIMENSEMTKGKLKDYAVTIDTIEKMIHRELFVRLDRRIKRRIQTSIPIKSLGLY